MQVRVSNNITITTPTPEIISWCQHNLKIPNPDYAKKARMGFWLGNTPKELYLYEIHGGELVIPYGCLKAVAPLLKDATVQSEFHPAVSVDYGEPIPLYPYQETAVKACVDGLYGILQSKAGSGKTQMGIALVKQFGKRALWLTHTKDLLNQSKERAERYMDSSLIGTITEGKVNIGSGITFATIQTMSKLDLSQYRDMWDTVVVDECFPKGTMIMTPHGQVPIEFIVPGELVVTRNDVTGHLELCEVEELQVRSIKGSIVRITLSNGEILHCTENHPIFTQDGYKKAGELMYGDEVRKLRKDFRYFCMEQKPTIKVAEWKKPSLLFGRLFEKRSGQALDMDGATPRYIEENDGENQQNFGISKNDCEQPYAQSGSKAKGVEHIEKNRAPTKGSRGKRQNNVRTSKSTFEPIESSQCSSRIRDPNEIKTSRLPTLLQNRHCFADRENRYRNRWWIALLSKGKDRRYEKDGVLERVRVERVEICERTSDGTFGGVCKNCRVYNISVESNHNYFANGILVHNCHRVAGTPTTMTQFSKVLNSLSSRHKYGLSATVHRSDGMIAATYALLGNVVYTVPDEAIADKVMRVGIMPVGTGVKISRDCLNTDGTLNYTELINYLCENGFRNVIIQECIVAESDKSCLILSDRLEHLSLLMNGLPVRMRDKAVMISGKMTTKKSKAEREQALEDMRTGRKKYLFATYSLAKEGLDIPCLERLFMATPQKDYAVITQSIGRIARVCEGKADPICYDFVDNIGYLVKSYKKRCATYRKNDCYFIVEGG